MDPHRNLCSSVFICGFKIFSVPLCLCGYFYDATAIERRW